MGLSCFLPRTLPFTGNLTYTNFNTMIAKSTPYPHRTMTAFWPAFAGTISQPGACVG